MKRRNLFRLACCAVAASAMEVFGIKPFAPKLLKRSQTDELFIKESEKLLRAFYEVRCFPSKFDSLILRKEFPKGAGFNYAPE